MRTLIVFIVFGLTSMCYAGNDAVPKQVEVNLTQLAYVDTGSGVPVVFIHGVIGDWRTFKPMQAMVSAKYRFISYSRRYHYPNKWDDGGENYTMTQHIEDLEEFIQTLNLGKVHLVGTAYGGRMAGLFALQHPEMVRTLTLTDPFIIQGNSQIEKTALEQHLDGFKQIAKLLKENRNQEAMLTFFDMQSDKQFGFINANADTRAIWQANAGVLMPLFTMTLPPDPSCSKLGQMNIPVMILSGTHAHPYYQLGDRKLARCLGADRVKFVSMNASHMLYNDQPEAAAKLILDFVHQH